MPTTHFCTLLIPEPTLIGNFSILVRCQWGKIISKHSYFDTAMCFLKLGLNLKFSAQESDLAPFVGNGTRVKAPFEIKLRLGISGPFISFSFSNVMLTFSSVFITEGF